MPFDHRKHESTQLAYDLARKMHEGQTDKSGKNYFASHVLDVANRAYSTYDRTVSAVDGWQIATIGLLHDILEDTPMTAVVLDTLFEPQIVRAVVALTRGKDEPYERYIQGVCSDSLASFVKIHDIHSNLDPSRLHLLDPDVQLRLVRKYTKALELIYTHRCQ